ncbi:MAG: ribosome silencing factor [Planctomycetota bacterium]
MRSPEQLDQARAFAIAAARAMKDDRCSNVRVLDVVGLTSICDFIVLGTGTSERQMRTVVKSLFEVAEETGFDHMGGHRRDSAGQSSNWVALDFIDVVTHVFDPDAREFYDLDNLYGDAKDVAWEEIPSSSDG